MRRTVSIAGTALLALVASAPFAVAQKSTPGVEIGKLTCAVQDESSFIVGSTNSLSCTFQPARGGPPTVYRGKSSEYGLDIGTLGSGTLVWGVLAPAADTAPGALEGTYAGVTAGASLGAGLKANALLGGLDKSIALNPLSVESQTGTNLTLGVTSLTLKALP
ncbi:MAG: hypothetical protein CMN87_05570 [Stappia sp.]|jgi:hypothetical protein|uniref:DUF992 domain-containing protein n=1 Tax=Stappia sp. TaxID=1870903 RepID=UPI000C685473|nr:DUF992 domain-containing protein [Stappia sp.]MAA98738.1 hypothetical protein [Stappia sp.]MBM19459.1 hypothetical protein [Stappia sp.]|tara:strand:- start:790 stop:1278 length:489 start_codon:yes stop_codon:yes gene_type:complete